MHFMTAIKKLKLRENNWLPSRHSFWIVLWWYNVIVISVYCGEKQYMYSPPQWAKEVVWYQIFPERFANGDSNNDPTVDDIVGAWPDERPREWQVTPWTSDWYEQQEWEKKCGKGFYYTVQLRRYGGDIQGIIDKLDYLAQLHVTALYLNPIFESPSLHKYDATMYHHVDNNFGPNPLGDREIWSRENPNDPATWRWTSADSLFLLLIKKCHERNIKIIIDGVFNHVGKTFWAFEDVRKKGVQSPYASWFTVTRFDDPTTVQNEFDYLGWYGVKELPELREDSNGFPSPVREHIRAVVHRWMDPNADGNPEDGIDGWRLDVANMVSVEFWKEFRRWTREINPQSYLVGEVWWEDWQNNIIYDPALWISDGSVFDAVMNYRAMIPLIEYCSAVSRKVPASEFMQRYLYYQQQFPVDVTSVQMNTVDSHDTDRLPSMIVNPDRYYDHYASVHDNPTYNVRKPQQHEITIQKMILALQFISTGAPTIYYGDEAGMWGGDDPDNRKPMVWESLHYMPEKSHPSGNFRNGDSVIFDKGLFRYYQMLIQLRYSHPALRYGVVAVREVDDKKDCIIFSKTTAGDTVVVCINNSRQEQTLSFRLPWSSGQKAIDLLTGHSYGFTKQTITMTIPPKSVRLIGQEN